MEIDIHRLREDLQDDMGTAMVNGFPAAIIDLINIDTLSDQELLEYAIKKKMDLNKYII